MEDNVFERTANVVNFHGHFWRGAFGRLDSTGGTGAMAPTSSRGGHGSQQRFKVQIILRRYISPSEALSETRNPEPGTRNQKPKARNPKPETRNPTPETLSLNPMP